LPSLGEDMGKLPDVPESIGASGEFFVFDYMQRRFPGTFSARNWVSALRQKYFPEMPPSDIDNALGADFVWTDPLGKLTGTPTKKLYLEVKLCAQHEPQPFRMHAARRLEPSRNGPVPGPLTRSRAAGRTRNEWVLAKQCHATRRLGRSGQLACANELYVVVVVTGVISPSAIRVAALVPDPIQQIKDGGATYEMNELVFSPRYQ